MLAAIEKESGYEVDTFLRVHFREDISHSAQLRTNNSFTVAQIEGNCNSIVNLNRVNDCRFINKMFEAVNEKLSLGGLYAGCFENYSNRRKRKGINKIPVLRGIYFFNEFLFMRVCPKVWGLKKIYFLLTKGRSRLLSKAEVLGRLVCCGFKINSVENINGLVYFVAEKVKTPAYDMSPSYGPIYRMRRVGKHGKIIGVYKFRTMHPYAEYLQDYVISLNGYNAKGKPADDFRLAPWGKFMRKYWLDELPQLINVLKGEMKIMGVRPLSETRFNEFPPAMRELRKKYKPGCIPPYVSLNMPDHEGNIIAERIYLSKKKKSPFTTDLLFTAKALFNILSNRIRSA
ncbi:MAG: sugar transferase [Bacteroidia bacterium]|nr:sugar transferase [Bacteroidia bacterium]